MITSKQAQRIIRLLTMIGLTADEQEELYLLGLSDKTEDHDAGEKLTARYVKRGASFKYRFLQNDSPQEYST